MKIALVTPYDYPYPGGVTEHIRHLDREFRALAIAPQANLEILGLALSKPTSSSNITRVCSSGLMLHLLSYSSYRLARSKLSWQFTQSVVYGMAFSRSGLISLPHLAHIPYFPSSRRFKAAWTCVKRCFIWLSRPTTISG